MYGTVENERFVPAPRMLTDENGKVHYHPRDAMYAAAGYLLRVDTEPPVQDESNPVTYAESYVVQNGQAVQVWTEVEPVIPPASIEERVTDCENALIELAALIGG